MLKAWLFLFLYINTNFIFSTFSIESICFQTSCHFIYGFLSKLVYFFFFHIEPSCYEIVYDFSLILFRFLSFFKIGLSFWSGWCCFARSIRLFQKNESWRAWTCCKTYEIPESQRWLCSSGWLQGNSIRIVSKITRNK